MNTLDILLEDDTPQKEIQSEFELNRTSTIEKFLEALKKTVQLHHYFKVTQIDSRTISLKSLDIQSRMIINGQTI